LFHLLIQVAMRRDRVANDILRPYGLSLTQWRALFYLGFRRTGSAMTELADYLVIDRTSLTRAVDKMVAAGLVLRTEPAHDRRMTQLTLTAAGGELRETLMALLNDHCERLVEGIPDEEVRRASRLLETVLERLVGHRAGARRLIDLL
jgi:DNA-binding MarR family transcriptional regulator